MTGIPFTQEEHRHLRLDDARIEEILAPFEIELASGLVIGRVRPKG